MFDFNRRHHICILFTTYRAQHTNCIIIIHLNYQKYNYNCNSIIYSNMILIYFSKDRTSLPPIGHTSSRRFNIPCLKLKFNKNTIVFQNFSPKNQFRDFVKPFQVVGRVSKHYVVPESTNFQICPGINMDRLYIGKTYFTDDFFNSCKIQPVNLYQVHHGSPRSKFKTDAACPGKQIQHDS